LALRRTCLAPRWTILIQVGQILLIRVSPIYLAFLIPRDCLLRQRFTPGSRHCQLAGSIVRCLFSFPFVPFVLSKFLSTNDNPHVATQLPPQHFVPSICALRLFSTCYSNFILTPPATRAATWPASWSRCSRNTSPGNFYWVWPNRVLSKYLGLAVFEANHWSIPCFRLEPF